MGPFEQHIRHQLRQIREGGPAADYDSRIETDPDSLRLGALIASHRIMIDGLIEAVAEVAAKVERVAEDAGVPLKPEGA